MNKKIFDSFMESKDEIEALFGAPLIWRRLDDKQACVIAFEMSGGGWKADHAGWPAIYEELTDAMGRFERAFSPQIAKLRTATRGEG